MEHITKGSAAGCLLRAQMPTHTAFAETRTISSACRLARSLAVLLGILLASSTRAQTPCPGSESCPGSVAQMVCPPAGTTLPGNDVTFTCCNANADYFLQIESIPGAHDIFYALVSFQNLVHLINVPTNGQTIYVTLWTQVHGAWQSPLNYTFTAANAPPSLRAPMFGTNGEFQVTISGVTLCRTNVVQNSIDLSTWTSISTNVAVATSLQIIDLAATNFNMRFYRTFEMR